MGRGRSSAARPSAGPALCTRASTWRPGGSGEGVAAGTFFFFKFYFLRVAKLRADEAWCFSRMWRELLTNTCFPAPSPGMPWTRGPSRGCDAGGGKKGGSRIPPPQSLVPCLPQGSHPQGLSCLAAAAKQFGPPGSSLRWGHHAGPSADLPKTRPGEGTPAAPVPACLSPGCLAACPARAGAQEGPRGLGERGGGARHARTHGVRSKAFFINEKNVQGLNDRQEQIYSSSPEIKLK